MLPLIQEHVAAQESGKSAPMTSTQIAFALPQASFSYNFYSVPIKGAFPYHETIEALLQGPPYAALAEGAITFIPHGTRLIGLTVSHKVAYIDFSKEFLSPTPWESSFTLRTEQIRKTLRQEYQVRDVRILVEGELLIKEKLSTEGLN